MLPGNAPQRKLQKESRAVPGPNRRANRGGDAPVSQPSKTIAANGDTAHVRSRREIRGTLLLMNLCLFLSTLAISRSVPLIPGQGRPGSPPESFILSLRAYDTASHASRKFACIWAKVSVA
jgi:hypothetical protein